MHNEDFTDINLKDGCVLCGNDFYHHTLRFLKNLGGLVCRKCAEENRCPKCGAWSALTDNQCIGCEVDAVLAYDIVGG